MPAACPSVGWGHLWRTLDLLGLHQLDLGFLETWLPLILAHQLTLPQSVSQLILLSSPKKVKFPVVLELHPEKGKLRLAF